MRNKKWSVVISGILAVSVFASTASAAFPPIENGDYGSHVKIVQQALKDQGYLSSEPDGNFGSNTENAVKEFQSSNGIEATGKVDEITYDVLTGQRSADSGAAEQEIKEIAENAPGNASEDIETTETAPDDNMQEQIEYDEKTETIKDYTGMNLASVGYTSMGGDRRDYYNDDNILLILRSLDGSYIDPDKKSVLQQYTVLSQSPAAGKEIVTAFDEKEDKINCSYNEIVLLCAKAGEDTSNIPELTELSPSPDRSIQYVKDYVGDTLEAVGYTSFGGDRLDYYGTQGLIKLPLKTEDGSVIDLGSTDLRNYYVTGQSVAPNTEISFAFTTNEDGEDEVASQSIDTIELTVAVSESGQAAIEEEAAREEELRANGQLQELYEGTYAIGTDLEEGNYEMTHLTDSCNVYVYDDEEKLNNNEGEWDFLYGAGDRIYYTLRDGMYLKISSGAVKAIRTELPSSGPELQLYSGIFRVGKDIDAGNYEISQISDSCNVYTYDNEEAYQNDDGDWDFLYGEGDTEYIMLKDGMILKISGGAAKAIKK